MPTTKTPSPWSEARQARHSWKAAATSKSAVVAFGARSRPPISASSTTRAKSCAILRTPTPSSSPNIRKFFAMWHGHSAAAQDQAGPPGRCRRHGRAARRRRADRRGAKPLRHATDQRRRRRLPKRESRRRDALRESLTALQQGATVAMTADVPPGPARRLGRHRHAGEALGAARRALRHRDQSLPHPLNTGAPLPSTCPSPSLASWSAIR